MSGVKIAIASDHAGFALKQFVRSWLEAAGHEVEDFGCRSPEPVDFTDYVYPAALAVSEQRAVRAVLVDGAGYPSAIVANLLPNVFAAVANDVVSAGFARTHSDTNVLCVGGKIIGEGTAGEVLAAWMNGKFLGGKYANRVEKLKVLAARHRPSSARKPLPVLTVQDLRDAVARRQALLLDERTIITPSVRDLLL
jgi:ribose 5-phosphate isomerase B